MEWHGICRFGTLKLAFWMNALWCICGKITNDLTEKQANDDNNSFVNLYKSLAREKKRKKKKLPSEMWNVPEIYSPDHAYF